MLAGDLSVGGLGRNKKLLGAPGIASSSKDATKTSWPADGRGMAPKKSRDEARQEDEPGHVRRDVLGL